MVGHCGFDAGALDRFVREALPEAEVAEAYSKEDIEEQAGPQDLLLINRVLGGGFGARSGVELIHALKGRGSPPVMMLVSNYEDAQQQAVEAGAEPGFGKNEIGSAAARQRLREAAGGDGGDGGDGRSESA